MIHFRKYISKKILEVVLEKYPNLIKISLSRYAKGRLSEAIIEIINEHGILVEVSEKGVGRPSLIERRYNNGFDFEKS